MEICGVIAYLCICDIEQLAHSGPHRCACGGSWTGDYGSDDFTVWASPNTAPNWARRPEIVQQDQD